MIMKMSKYLNSVFNFHSQLFGSELFCHRREVIFDELSCKKFTEIGLKSAHKSWKQYHSMDSSISHWWRFCVEYFADSPLLTRQYTWSSFGYGCTIWFFTVLIYIAHRVLNTKRYYASLWKSLHFMILFAVKHMIWRVKLNAYFALPI